MFYYTLLLDVDVRRLHSSSPLYRGNKHPTSNLAGCFVIPNTEPPYFPLYYCPTPGVGHLLANQTRSTYTEAI